MVDFVVHLYTLVVTGVSNFFDRSVADVLRDCLDIGIVSTLIYAALVMLKGTRAMQMAIGMGLLLLGYAGARQFDMALALQRHELGLAEDLRQAHAPRQRNVEHDVAHVARARRQALQSQALHRGRCRAQREVGEPIGNRLCNRVDEVGSHRVAAVDELRRDGAVGIAHGRRWRCARGAAEWRGRRVAVEAEGFDQRRRRRVRRVCIRATGLRRRGWEWEWKRDESG